MQCCYFTSPVSVGVKALNLVNALMLKFQSLIVLEVSDPGPFTILITKSTVD